MKRRQGLRMSRTDFEELEEVMVLAVNISHYGHGCRYRLAIRFLLRESPTAVSQREPPSPPQESTMFEGG